MVFLPQARRIVGSGDENAVGCKIEDMRSRLYFVISGHSGVLVKARGNIHRISSNCPAQLQIKDTIKEVKYGCLWLLVEVFMKVMNGLVMTLEEDKRFLCVWLLYYVSNFADSRMKVPRYRSSPTSWDHFFSQCIQQQWSVSQNYFHSE